MNNQLLMDNYLLILKSTVEVYVHGTLESSNENIRELLKLGLDETMAHQARTYNLMTDYGWYKVEAVENQKIAKAYQKASKN